MHTGAGSSHTFFCLWFFSSSLFPFPPGSDGDIRRLMTMFHTRGWGEEDNRLVSRVDFKHTQLLARRRPGQRLLPGRGDAPGSAGLSPAPRPPPLAPRRPAREVKAPPGHGPGCAPFPNPPLPKTQRFSPSSTRERFLRREGCPRSSRGAATSLLPSSLPGWEDAGDLYRWPRRPGRWPGAR